MTREASIFPENEDSVTPPFVDETYAGLFTSVVQSAVPPLGKFVIRLASKFPENEDNATSDCCIVTQSGACFIGSLILANRSVPPKL